MCWENEEENLQSEENVGTNCNGVKEECADEVSRFCQKCGAKVNFEQSFCGVCGVKIDAVAKPKWHKKLLFAIVGVVAVVIVAVGLFAGGSANFDFNEEYAEYADEYWCYISADGSCMEIDTNPYDRKSYTNYFAMSAIEDVNIKLGFSESLITKMKSTRALDGTQNDENDKFSVSWTYHPNKGLNVVYEKKN